MVEIRAHTALRGIAAIFVMLGHYRLTLTPAFEVDRYTLLFDRGYVWVDLFFILSGFILCYVYGSHPGRSLEGAVNFLRARFARIYPLHFVALLFLLGLRINNGEALTIDWNYFFQTLFLIQAWGAPMQFNMNPVTWSLSVEFAAYLLFVPFCFLLHRSPIGVKIVLVTLLVYWLAYPIVTESPRSTMARCLPIFFLGTLVFAARDIAQMLDDWILSVLQVASITSVVAVLHYGLGGIILVLPFAVLAFSTQTDIGLFSRAVASPLFAYCGALSYSIYILHIPIMSAAVMMLKPASPAVTLLTVAIALATTLISSHFSYKYFEMPVRKLIAASRHTAVTA